MDRNFDILYNELVGVSQEILAYYDIDKIKPYAVYVWTKDDDAFDGENVFDIEKDELIIYDKSHVIPEDVKMIIEKIQSKLKEFDNL